ncbi:related to SEC9 - protein transport protein [Melanopsichium pennsylvanicum]|uniref:Protein transport protein SEC9 n=2 Tax=Melanopsichium pennsylvanicum TaxID=63383 RepID=A0AAJ4XML3_9BASI|nr:related to SEC9-protein transport protein [Melanopsichium pennsylvanicum 4]SNX83813.1 related to SEC9 - protein transport protein [Melanopsichium pennsylvanicum]
MGLFGKKNSSKIPPVESPQSSQPGGPGRYGHPGSGAGPSRQGGASGLAHNHSSNTGNGGAGYNAGPPQTGYGGGGYGHQQYGGAPNATPAYQERFANARAPNAGFGSGYDQYAGIGGNKSSNLSRNVQNQRGGVEDDLEAEYGRGSGAGVASHGYDGLEQQEEQRDEEDDEVEAVKQQMRFTKQESLSSTRNALRIAREAEETATNTMFKLSDQSEKIGNTERSLDLAKAHASRAEDNAKEIVALNRSIFRPNVQFNKKAKRDAEEARIIARHIDEREEREAVRRDVTAAQSRLDASMNGPGTGKANFGRFGQDRFGSSKKAEEAAQRNKVAQRGRYQFEATESDDELEDELDQNLDEIGMLSSRLNQLGKAMGQEVDSQNSRLQRIGDKATTLDTKIFAGTQRLGNIK